MAKLAWVYMLYTRVGTVSHNWKTFFKDVCANENFLAE